jgi:hypothetical protein
MNVFTRLGMWWDKPSVREELERLQKSLEVPNAFAKELMLMRLRLERIELLVGLKREPVVVQVPDAPRIS